MVNYMLIHRTVMSELQKEIHDEKLTLSIASAIQAALMAFESELQKQSGNLYAPGKR